MVAILEKSDAAEGFEQIIDFLSGSYINHALTVNPHVYISCIKQFWNTAVVKRSGQRFNFSKYIFESLVRNVDSSSKFYMYPRFIQLFIQTNIADLSNHTTRYMSPVLTQKVFANMRRVGKGFSGVETPLFESMLAVRDVAEDVEAQVPTQGDDVQEPTAKEVANDVVSPTPTSPSPSSPVIPSSPPNQPPCPPQPQDAEGSSLLFQRILDTCSALVLRVEGLENDKASQQLEIVKLKARVKKLEKISKVKSSKLRRLKMLGIKGIRHSHCQVKARLVEFKNQEIKFCEKIRSLEFKVESKTDRIENLTNELEMLKKEKEGLDSKLTGFQSASKDLDNIKGSQRSDKNKKDLGYSAMPLSCSSLFSS
nr:hypothetical protein [Tanacetum cinerariifolium]